MAGPPPAAPPIPHSVDRAALGPWARFVDDFAESLRVAGYAKRTVWLYPHHAGRFAAWLVGCDRRAPALVTPEDCLAFQRALYYHRTRKGVPYPLTTQVGFLTAVRAFTRFWKRSGYALVDPGLAIQSPRTPKRLPREIMTEEEVVKLLALPDVRTARGARDRAILEILYSTGVRAGEIAALDLGDVDLASGRLHVREGKGGRDRVVPMGAVAAEFVGGYVRNVRPRLLGRRQDAALFLRLRGGRITETHLERVVAGYVARAGITKKVTPHVFRHTCATHMLKGGAGIRHVQALLGHKSLATTERYTKVEIGDLAEVHERCHPRERL
jgi:integrase/recombinase XerD